MFDPSEQIFQTLSSTSSPPRTPHHLSFWGEIEFLDFLLNQLSAVTPFTTIPPTNGLAPRSTLRLQITNSSG